MAPPILPTEVKRRRGTLRKDRTPGPLVPIERAPIDLPPPSSLKAAGRAEWRHTLETCPWVGLSDLTAVRLLCQQVDIHERLLAEIEARPPETLALLAAWLETLEMEHDAGDLTDEEYEARRQVVERAGGGPNVTLWTSTGYAYTNPLLIALNKCEDQIDRWLKALGKTASARSALGVAEVKAASTLDKLASRRAARTSTP